MAAALIGHIETFDPDTDDWSQYVERMTEMFKANDLMGDEKEEKRRAIFLMMVGKRTYNILRSLLTPAKPTAKKFEELTELLSAHFSPPPSEALQRFRFYGRVRQPGESVAAFVAELRKLSEHCNFGDSLNKALRDRIIGIINDDAIRDKLLGERTLTYERAVEIAQGVETKYASLREMTTLHKPVTVKSEPVHRVDRGRGSRTRPPRRTTACSRCGTEGHAAIACRFKDKTCNYCRKKGHIARVCRRRLQQATSEKPERKVNHLEEETTSDSEEDEAPIHTVISLVKNGRERSPPIVVRVCVNGVELDMEVDTGASVSLMSEDSYYKLFPNCPLNATQVRLQTYLGEAIPVVGSVVAHVSQQADLPLIVIKGKGPTLLGRTWLKQIILDWPTICYAAQPGLSMVLDQHIEVFEDGLGTFRDYEARLEIDPQAQPRFNKARSVPYAMKKGIEEELDRLVAEGTLQPVDYSDWAAPIVAVLKPDKKSVRICGDFRTTVNPVSKLHRYPVPRVENLFAGLVKGKTFSTIDLKQAYQQMKLDPASQKYLVINTHRGLFKYTRLPYGVSSAPGLF